MTRRVRLQIRGHPAEHPAGVFPGKGSLFEKEGKKYKEIFTGFEADIIEKHFNLPYAIDIVPLIEVHEDLKGTTFPRLGMLLLFNNVNKKEKQEEKDFQKKLESDNK